jgi:CMP/dCMP kinase
MKNHSAKTHSPSRIPPVITVDGPGGTGKGTLSRLLAKYLNWHFLDSGALYRILAYVALKKGVDLQDEESLTALVAPLKIKFIEHSGGDAQVFLDDQEITQAIRTEQCGQVASQISVFPKVRQALIKRQQDFRQPPGLVADGRDMGTIIFPEAELKIYLIASQEERARRRYEQLKKSEINASLQHILAELCVRDLRDQNRIVAPLKPAEGAIIIDTTSMSIGDVFKQVILEITKIWPSLSKK